MTAFGDLLDESILIERLSCSEGRYKSIVQARLQSDSVVPCFGINPFMLKLAQCLQACAVLVHLRWRTCRQRAC
jgi:hypothetical protein